MKSSSDIWPVRLLNKYLDDVPIDAVSIMRPSRAGNPFVLGRDGNRDEVCVKYARYFASNAELRAWCDAELRGRDLVCCCAPKRCHGETILKYLYGKQASGLFKRHRT